MCLVASVPGDLSDLICTLVVIMQSLCQMVCTSGSLGLPIILLVAFVHYKTGRELTSKFRFDRAIMGLSCCLLRLP